MAAAAILICGKLLLFLYFWTNPHQIWWDCCEFDLECNCCVRNTYLQKFKMVAAAIFLSEKLWPFLYYWTNPHQIWLDCCKSDIECNSRAVNTCLPKFKMAVAAISVLEKLLPLLLPILDNFLPSLVWMLLIRYRTQLFMSKTHNYQIPRWRLPPYWVTKNCCHFINCGPHQILWECRSSNSDIERNWHVKNALLPKIKMAAFLISNYVVNSLCYLTNPRLQIYKCEVWTDKCEKCR